MAILKEIVGILVGGIGEVSAGIGAGLQSLMTSIFLTSGGDALSTFGTLIIVFAGIGLALGLCRWALNFVTSLGQRNR